MSRPLCSMCEGYGRILIDAEDSPTGQQEEHPCDACAQGRRIRKKESKPKLTDYQRGAHAMRCAVVMWLQEKHLETGRLEFACLRDEAAKLELPIAGDKL